MLLIETAIEDFDLEQDIGTAREETFSAGHFPLGIHKQINVLQDK